MKNLSADELRITDVTLVGQYALQVAFESGHNTGIYTFALLRRLADQAEPPAPGAHLR